MKIAIVSPWFSTDMGYAENFLPKAFGRLGHDAHLLTSDLQVYATSPQYDTIYKKKLGDRRVPEGVLRCDGFSLHRFRGHMGRWGVNIPQLAGALDRLRPDLVYCFEINCPTTVLVAQLRSKLGYILFCESRLHASIFSPPIGLLPRLKRRLANWLIGTPAVVKNVDRFYPLGQDVLSIITTYFGVPPTRCTLSSLAVETQIFFPRSEPNTIRKFRETLGFHPTDMICVYTGRITSEKGPLVLAKAIDLLRAQGHAQIRGLFVGDGDSVYLEQITACDGCVTHPFVAPRELASIYQASDVGVWPLQESTSQLDAMACGLPIIVNESVQDSVRLGEGAFTFEKNNIESLASRILNLQDRDQRRRSGEKAAARTLKDWSWDEVARRRVMEAIQERDALKVVPPL